MATSDKSRRDAQKPGNSNAANAPAEPKTPKKVAEMDPGVKNNKDATPSPNAATSDAAPKAPQKDANASSNKVQDLSLIHI